MLHSPGCVCHRISIEKKRKATVPGASISLFSTWSGAVGSKFHSKKETAGPEGQMRNTVGTSAQMDGRNSSARDTTPAPLGHGRQRQTAERKLPNLKHVASRTRSASPRVGPAASPRCKLRRDPGTDKTVACTKDHTIKSF